MAERRTGRTARILGSLAILVIVAICTRLGFWQLARLEQKQMRNEALAERMAEAPVRITSSLGDTAGLIFRHAVAHGTYDDERSIILPGRSFRGSPGVLLLTPLKLAGARAVLVQRGWVPSADAVNVDLSAFRTDTTVTVNGLVLPFPSDDNTIAARARDAAPADTFRRVWYAVDDDELRAQFPYPLLPLRLQRLPDSSTAPVRARTRSYPLAQEPPALDEGPHLGYAIQWFSFALIFGIGWIALLRTRGSRG